MRPDLTDRQRLVLHTIADYRARNDLSPSVRELCELLEVSSTNGIVDHLKALEAKNCIWRDRRKARAMWLTPTGLAEVRP